MTPATWVEIVVSVGTVLGAALMCLVDPAGLAQAKYGTPTQEENADE